MPGAAGGRRDEQLVPDEPPLPARIDRHEERTRRSGLDHEAHLARGIVGPAREHDAAPVPRARARRPRASSRPRRPLGSGDPTRRAVRDRDGARALRAGRTRREVVRCRSPVAAHRVVQAVTGRGHRRRQVRGVGKRRGASLRHPDAVALHRRVRLVAIEDPVGDVVVAHLVPDPVPRRQPGVEARPHDRVGRRRLELVDQGLLIRVAGSPSRRRRTGTRGADR